MRLRFSNSHHQIVRFTFFALALCYCFFVFPAAGAATDWCYSAATVVAVVFSHSESHTNHCYRLPRCLQLKVLHVYAAGDSDCTIFVNILSSVTWISGLYVVCWTLCTQEVHLFAQQKKKMQPNQIHSRCFRMFWMASVCVCVCLCHHEWWMREIFFHLTLLLVMHWVRVTFHPKLIKLAHFVSIA